MNRKSIAAAFLTFFATVSLTFADSKDTTTLTSQDGQYQLVVSDKFETADFKVDNVEISAINKSRGEYVEVIAEDQGQYTSSLTRYAQAKRDTMALSLDNPRLTALEQIKINGHNAVRCEIHGQLPNTDTSIGYSLTVLKTKSDYIQIVAWTKESLFSLRKNGAGIACGRVF